jgi:hypothetical protein
LNALHVAEGDYKYFEFWMLQWILIFSVWYGSVNQTVSSPFPCVHCEHAPNGHMGNKKFSKRALVSSHQT